MSEVIRSLSNIVPVTVVFYFIINVVVVAMGNTRVMQPIYKVLKDHGSKSL